MIILGESECMSPAWLSVRARVLLLALRSARIIARWWFKNASSMCEVTRQNLDDLFPQIEKDIKDAKFVCTLSSVGKMWIYI